jgi:hypothetical protein
MEREKMGKECKERKREEEKRRSKESESVIDKIEDHTKRKRKKNA